MLVHLAIHDFVIVRTLEIEFDSGFCALTGETGVGKSVVLAGLDMALGARTDRSVLRPGADRAETIASFALQDSHPVKDLLAEQDIPLLDGEALILRRQIRREGVGRAFINDRPVSAGLLRETGQSLIELHGQRAGLSLLEPAGQLLMLDAWAQITPARAECARNWQNWQDASASLNRLQEQQGRSETEYEYLSTCVQELDTLDPQTEEAGRLTTERLALQRHEQIGQSVEDAVRLLNPAQSGDDPVSRLSGAANALYKAVESSGANSPLLVTAQEALDRALAETEEAIRAVYAAQADTEASPQKLESIETRLFELRAIGRKHRADPDQLPQLRDQLAEQLARIEHAEHALAEAQAEVENAKRTYHAAANDLSAARAKAAHELAHAMRAEMEPLRLNRMQFRVSHRSDESLAGPNGRDRIVFEIAPQGDENYAPLSRIASGGEFSRLSLALRVCLAGPDGASSLIFDEVDAGIGGATAAAVGERLAKLGRMRQIVSVTHSPQVAASAGAQWRIIRNAQGTEPVVIRLDEAGRREEIARMLAGSSITDEARIAADRLLAGN